MKILLIPFSMLVSFVFSLVETPKQVMLMEVKGTIDPRTSRYVRLALDHAKRTHADVVIVDMDTYGGVLTDAKDIVDVILDLNVPIWVFINKDAASAGALISIACDSIYMAPGSTIGAATVVNRQGDKAPDKYQSYMRSIMRATAEETGRDPRIAEAMVDQDIAIEGVSVKGEVVALTTSEAIKHGFCEAKINSIKEILSLNGVEEYEMSTFEPDMTDRIIAFFINPFISGLLILLVIGGVYFELQSPGVGFPLIAAIVGLVLYLVPYYLNGLAENWEIITLFVGILLLFAEVFIIPGFGIAGILGIVFVLGALMLIMLDNDFFNFDRVLLTDIRAMLFSVFGGLAGAIILLLLFGRRIAQTGPFRWLSLTMTQDVSKGYTVNVHTEDLIGKAGVTHTRLRPGGKVMIDNQLYDAFSRGDYIDKGEKIEVIGIESTTLKVKKQLT